MKVLYVTTNDGFDAALVLGDLHLLKPGLEIQSIVGAAGALVEIRTVGGYGVLFLGPSVPHNEALALIATLRRDRTPIAIVAIVLDADRAFFAPAVTAGADDVLVFRDRRLVALEDTLRRVRQNRHTIPDAGQPRLRVLYAGQDELAWDLLGTIHFINSDRTTADRDGAVSLEMTDPTGRGPCDVLVIDESPGDAHALQVVKWVKARHPIVPVVVLTPPMAGDVGGAALELGADEIVSKSGTYRRRLVASLHRQLLRRLAAEETATGSTVSASAPASGPVPNPQAAVPDPRHLAEIDRLTDALREAEEHASSLAAKVQSTQAHLAVLQAEHDRLVEAQAFERALRDQDRDELAALARELQEERKRHIVLERTLRQTEDQAGAERAALEVTLAAARKQLEEEVARAADRVQDVAPATQVLQAQLELQFAERAAERDRLMDNSPVGYAVFTRSGRLLRCSATFAAMAGFSTAEDAVAAGGDPFAGTPDHGRLVAQLDEAGSSGVDRMASTLRRADGRPVRILTSAVLVPAAGGTEDHVECLFVDLTDRMAMERELRLARRLETAGRLAAEMASTIEGELEAARPHLSADRTAGFDHAILLVKQLLAFSRYQAKPAGFLSLNPAITRMEALLRQLAGDAVELRVELGETEPVTAGEDDIEHLIIELVTAAAACLPFGGRIVLATSLESDSTFVLRTSLSVTATGYGVLPANLSPSLARYVARCGGLVQVTGEAGRTSTLHVLLPC